MALSPNDKLNIDRKLELMKADGFFLPSHRSMSGDARYLIVSYGGTGADALFGVKKKLEQVLDPKEMNERIRLLAVDTDQSTQKVTKKQIRPDGTEEQVEVDSLDASQFFLLSGKAAQPLISEDSGIMKWMNSELPRRIQAENTFLNDDGASGIRQLGRATLFPGNTRQNLCNKIKALINQLVLNTNAPLKVFILTGIAGGTGSGTVIDLTYLIHYVIRENIGGMIADRTSYAGFVLLPPTGTSTLDTAIQSGNRNGYAALKEINHFMTMSEHGGTYSLTYSDGTKVESREKIFNICYLLDGSNDEVIFKNPRQRAVSVLSNCLLDMITSSQAGGDDKTKSVDSFMNDVPMVTVNMISGQSTDLAPRDADYIYCALGHSEFSMPANEIKAYVARELFTKIYGLFKNCEKANYEDAEAFVREVIRSGAKSEEMLDQNLFDNSYNILTNVTASRGGPFYLINLLYEVPNVISNMKAKWIKPASNEVLDYINSWSLQRNNDMFLVYTAAMEGMKNLMENQYNEVVTTSNNGRHYSFFPKFVGDSRNHEFILSYLDGLINPDNLNHMVHELMKELSENADAWLELVNSDNHTAENTMREFWNKHLDEMIHASIEDFLIKYYSGNTTMAFSSSSPDATDKYLKDAAKEIYSDMMGVKTGAQPMVTLTKPGITPKSFNAHTYLLVPACAPNILRELKKLATEDRDGNVEVRPSMSIDRISCYKQYTSIPAFKLDWVWKAEKDYEDSLHTAAAVGLHMSETELGDQWKNLPNLLPATTWSKAPQGIYVNSREKEIADRAVDLFERAVAIGLTEEKQTDMHVMEYAVKLLPEQMRPGKELFRDLDRCVDGSELKKEKLQAIEAAAKESAVNIYKMLLKANDGELPEGNLVSALEAANNKLKTVRLNFPLCVLSIGPSETRPENWDHKIAACNLRKLPDVMAELDGSLMVLELLQEKLDKKKLTDKLLNHFAWYLCTHIFEHQDATDEWGYRNNDDLFKSLFPVFNDVDNACSCYKLFTCYRDKYEKIDADVKNVFLNNGVNDAEPDKRDRRIRFQKAAAEYVADLSVWDSPVTPLAGMERDAKHMGINVNATIKFHHDLRRIMNSISRGIYTIDILPASAVYPVYPENDPDYMDNDPLEDY